MKILHGESVQKDESISRPFEPVDYELEPSLTKDEVRKALKDIKNNKSPGSNNLPVELIILELLVKRE